MYQTLITSLIAIFGTINIIRIGFFMIGADIYSIKEAARVKKQKRRGVRLPYFTVVIPAHNEEGIILHSLQSVVNNNYPTNKLQIIVADDGSTDKTADLVKEYKKLHPKICLEILTQENAGKAHALNNAIRSLAIGELVMCLDADSSLHPDALSEAAQYFYDKRVVAMAANVKIRPTGTLFNLIQQYEYIVSYQVRRALTVFNIEYIIGGVGSVFRRRALLEVGLYDTNTITEDIDLTMKLLQKGNKQWRGIFWAQSTASTESVFDLAGLIRPPCPWKVGPTQTFYKHRNLFFNSNKKHNRFLTLFYLPFSVYSDIAFFFEPLIVSYIVYLIIRYGDMITLLAPLCVVGGYITLNVLVEHTIPLKQRFKLAAIAPTMYFFFYILSLAEYVALIHGGVKAFTVKKSVDANVANWQHVERPKIA